MLLLKRTIGALLFIALAPAMVLGSLMSTYYTDWTFIEAMEHVVEVWHRTFWLARSHKYTVGL